jgi:hypothetical protein
MFAALLQLCFMGKIGYKPSPDTSLPALVDRLLDDDQGQK